MLPGWASCRAKSCALPRSDMVDDDGQKLKGPAYGLESSVAQPPHPLWHGIDDGARFYFVHSYYVKAAESRRMFLAGRSTQTNLPAPSRKTIFLPCSFIRKKAIPPDYNF